MSDSEETCTQTQHGSNWGHLHDSELALPVDQHLSAYPSFVAERGSWVRLAELGGVIMTAGGVGIVIATFQVSQAQQRDPHQTISLWSNAWALGGVALAGLGLLIVAGGALVGFHDWREGRKAETAENYLKKRGLIAVPRDRRNAADQSGLEPHSWDVPLPLPTVVPSVNNPSQLNPALRLALRRVLTELEIAHSALQSAAASGELAWNPSLLPVKAWKKHKGTIELEATQELWSEIQHAFAEIDRLNTRRNNAWMAGAIGRGAAMRQVRPTDKLTEAVAAVGTARYDVDNFLSDHDA